MTDLTDVRVANRWAYVCLIIDLFNREIIALSLGWHKTALWPLHSLDDNAVAEMLKPLASHVR